MLYPFNSATDISLQRQQFPHHSFCFGAGMVVAKADLREFPDLYRLSGGGTEMHFWSTCMSAPLGSTEPIMTSFSPCESVSVYAKQHVTHWTWSFNPQKKQAMGIIAYSQHYNWLCTCTCIYVYDSSQGKKSSEMMASNRFVVNISSNS